MYVVYVRVSAASKRARHSTRHCDEALRGDASPHMSERNLPPQRHAIASKLALLCNTDAGAAQKFLSRFLQEGAPPQGLHGLPQPSSENTAKNGQFYSLEELRLVLKKLSSSKASVHCPNAAVKVDSLAGQELTLKLCNLGRLCGMAPSLWCLRHVTPMRKSGPLVVTSTSHLRPISKSSDMAAVQDSLKNSVGTSKVEGSSIVWPSSSL